jgi:DNA-binding transcriptional ArsR family regulator
MPEHASQTHASQPQTSGAQPSQAHPSQAHPFQASASPAASAQAARRAAALALLRHLRRLDEAIGVKHSSIARDIGLLLHEAGERGLSVNQVSARTGYTGPTVRLVLDRLTEAKAVAAAGQLGKTRIFRLTPRGVSGFDAYVNALWAFAEAARAATLAPAASPAPVSAADPPAPAPDRPAGPQPPPARYAGAPPARPAAE